MINHFVGVYKYAFLIVIFVVGCIGTIPIAEPETEEAGGPPPGVQRGEPDKDDEEKAADQALEASKDEYEKAPCAEAHPHPQGVKISKKYEVKYIEVMTWLCEGYGFGQIRQAYSAQAETDVTVAALFARLDMGEDWDSILGDIGATAIEREED